MASRLEVALDALRQWDSIPAACPHGCPPPRPRTGPDALDHGAVSPSTDAVSPVPSMQPQLSSPMTASLPGPPAGSDLNRGLSDYSAPNGSLAAPPLAVGQGPTACGAPATITRNFALCGPSESGDGARGIAFAHAHYRRLHEQRMRERAASRRRSGTQPPAERHVDAAATPASCYLHAAADRFGNKPQTGGTSVLAVEDPRVCGGDAERAYARRVAAELETKRAVAEEPAPVLNKRERAMAAMRSVVSQNKIRFQEDGFDLDLTYITPRIIAMGFPSTGREAYYRNPMPEVERFFAKRHPGHFRVYNLCREREYDVPTRFGGSHRRFPFDDHNAPSDLQLIPAFIKDAMAFLDADEENVVAIHCKAGKGRTGLMVSCLLMATDPTLRAPQDALQYFSDVRTNDSQGVTIPSQMRYVRYWGELMDRYEWNAPTQQRKLYLNRLVVHTLVRAKATAPLDVYFTVHHNNEEIFDGRRCALGTSGSKLFQAARNAYVFDFISGGNAESDLDDDALAAKAATSTAASPRVLLLTLTGDVRFTVYRRTKVMADEELFHFWLNSTMCDYPKQRIEKLDLDGANKDRKHRDFLPDLAVTLVFEAPEWNAEQQRKAAADEAAQGAQPAAAPVKAKKGFFSRVFRK